MTMRAGRTFCSIVLYSGPNLLFDTFKGIATVWHSFYSHVLILTDRCSHYSGAAVFVGMRVIWLHLGVGKPAALFFPYSH